MKLSLIFFEEICRSSACLFN